MINIIKSNKLLKNKIDNGYKYISQPFKKFSTIIAYEDGISKEIEQIISEVDSCKISGMNIISKFTDTPIELGKVSDGCKTVVYVYFCTSLLASDNEIIDITECGPNAIRYILEHYGNKDATLYLSHSEFPDDVNVSFYINDTIKINSTMELFAE